jgi:hypothetical protein
MVCEGVDARAARTCTNCYICTALKCWWYVEGDKILPSRGRMRVWRVLGILAALTCSSCTSLRCWCWVGEVRSSALDRAHACGAFVG